MMNKTQEQIKKLKSREIEMQKCIYVEHEREKCRETWIDEMVMKLGVWWFEMVWNHPKIVHEFKRLKMIKKWVRIPLEY